MYCYISAPKPQHVVQSRWSGGLQASGHSTRRVSPASTIAATKLLVEFFLLVGKGVVLEKCEIIQRTKLVSDKLPGKCFTEVRIMGDSWPLCPGPNVSFQESLKHDSDIMTFADHLADLIRTVSLPGRPEHGVVWGRPPGLPEHPPDLGPLGAQPHAPAAAENLNAMGRVIAHEVKMFLGLKPVLWIEVKTLDNQPADTAHWPPWLPSPDRWSSSRDLWRRMSQR